MILAEALKKTGAAYRRLAKPNTYAVSVGGKFYTITAKPDNLYDIVADNLLFSTAVTWEPLLKSETFYKKIIEVQQAEKDFKTSKLAPVKNSWVHGYKTTLGLVEELGKRSDNITGCDFVEGVMDGSLRLEVAKLIAVAQKLYEAL